MKLLIAGLCLALLSGCSSVIVKHQEEGVTMSYMIHTEGSNEILIENGKVKVKKGGEGGEDG